MAGSDHPSCLKGNPIPQNACYPQKAAGEGGTEGKRAALLQKGRIRGQPRKSRADGPGYAAIKEAGIERGETYQVQSSEDLFPLPEHHTEGDMNRNPRSRC